jgi:hypothetical protein
VLIKSLLLLAIAVIVVLAVRAPTGARHLALRRMSISAFAVLAVLSVLFPDAWNAAAAAVGVGRGTDLLLYGLIIVVLLYMVTTYRRFRAMETSITLLARRIAIDEMFTPLSPHPAPGPGSSPSTPTPSTQTPSTPTPSTAHPVAPGDVRAPQDESGAS